MQLPVSILLADLAELLKNAIPVIFVILYGIAHLVGMMQEKKKAPPRPRPAPPAAPPPPAGQAAAQRPAGNLEDSLRREVEEFLRRAQGGQPEAKAQEKRPAERPPQRPQPPRQPASPRSSRPIERPAAEQPPARRLEPMRPESTLAPLRTAVEAQGAGAAALPPVGGPLRTQAAQHARLVTQHAQTLGADVALADERMEQHLREKFVHQVGGLTHQATTAERTRAAAAAMSPAVEQLRELLARPGGMRQLIIANEILRRPAERWDS